MTIAGDKVYLLQMYHDDEGETFCGVYASRERPEAVAMGLMRDDQAYDLQWERQTSEERYGVWRHWQRGCNAMTISEEVVE